MVTTAFGGLAVARALVTQPDGKIVAAGSASVVERVEGAVPRPDVGPLGMIRILPADFALARYRPDGALDAEFGNEGTITTDFGGDDDGVGLVAQADGKLVLAGTARPVEPGETWLDRPRPADAALARYNPDGTLDSSFGRDGRVVTDLADSDEIAAVAIQADGKLVLAGTSRRAGAGHRLDAPELLPGDAIVAARFEPDGTLDPSFGTGGVVVTRLPDAAAQAHAVAIQPDGRIVVAATTIGPWVPGKPFGNHFLLVRYADDGALDASFGTGGVVRTEFDTFAAASALVIQPDGKLVVAGGAFQVVLARYNPDGTLDPGFGVGGRVITDRGLVEGGGQEAAMALAIQSDGKLVAAGLASNRAAQPSPVPTGGFGIFRYLPDGSLDASFGSGGVALAAFGTSGFLPDMARAVAIQADGKIVAAGMTRVGENEHGFGLMRFQDR